MNQIDKVSSRVSFIRSPQMTAVVEQRKFSLQMTFHVSFFVGWCSDVDASILCPEIANWMGLLKIHPTPITLLLRGNCDLHNGDIRKNGV